MSETPIMHNRCDDDHDEIIRLRSELHAFRELSDERQTVAQRATDTLEKVSADQRAQANEWRGTVRDVASAKADLTALDRALDRIVALEKFRGQIAVVGPLALLAASVIGAALGRAIFGG